jgi:hypothetical protein
MNDAQGLQRRAENLLALAKKARDDNYTQLADYILDRADQLFEEARIRELVSSTVIDKIEIWGTPMVDNSVGNLRARGLPNRV